MRGWWRHKRCGHHNVYIGREGDSKRTIDARCGYCGQRVCFESHRPSTGPGRNRSVVFAIRPDWMPRFAIIKEVQNRNSGIPKNAILHFRKLGEIARMKRWDMPGSIARREADMGLREIDYTFERIPEDD